MWIVSDISCRTLMEKLCNDFFVGGNAKQEPMNKSVKPSYR